MCFTATIQSATVYRLLIRTLKLGNLAPICNFDLCYTRILLVWEFPSLHNPGLSRREAAVRILTYAQQHLDVELKESW
ncbi:hypothetical protein Tco_1277927 [Tanacetum coccineum]